MITYLTFTLLFPVLIVSLFFRHIPSSVIMADNRYKIRNRVITVFAILTIFPVSITTLLFYHDPISVTVTVGTHILIPIFFSTFTALMCRVSLIHTVRRNHCTSP